MRTTVEITDAHHQALSALAHKRGLRGLSSLIEEALDAYLQDVSADEIDHLLSLEGTLSDREADKLRDRIDDMRATWRAA
jgi:metal-responsive CopG/Arc/MetJ family transcriptional regulator